MADNNTEQYKLKSDVRLEFILASLTKEDYKTRLDSLSEALKQYDPKVLPTIDKYIWLVESSMDRTIPSVATLTNEFPELNFIDVKNRI